MLSREKEKRAFEFLFQIFERSTRTLKFLRRSSVVEGLLEARGAEGEAGAEEEEEREREGDDDDGVEDDVEALPPKSSLFKAADGDDNRSGRRLLRLASAVVGGASSKAIEGEHVVTVRETTAGAIFASERERLLEKKEEK